MVLSRVKKIIFILLGMSLSACSYEIPKQYVPDLDFSKTDVYGTKQVVYVSTNEQLQATLKKVKPYTTIILKDGIYRDMNVFIQKGTRHITLKSETKHGAKIIPKGYNDRSAIYFPYIKSESERDAQFINLVDFEVMYDGKEECNFRNKNIKGCRQFVRAPSGGVSSAHHVYIKGVKMHDLFTGIYTGLHAHDWTADQCEWYNAKYSRMWYMKGWHHSVQNSVMYNGIHDSLAIRGYYPLGERYFYDESKNTGNIFVDTRKDRKGFLAKDDWTHMVINNTFGAWDLSNSARKEQGGNHVVIAYEEYEGDKPWLAEQVYLPPQNVVIANNAFSNAGGKPYVINAIKIAARKGINTKNIASVNGIYIFNNAFDGKESNFIVAGKGKDGTHVDLSLIDVVKDNHIESRKSGFASTSKRDYHITERSVDLINKGSNKVHIRDDFNGKKRDATPDIGAFEF